MTDPEPTPGPVPRVHERAGAVLAAAGVDLPERRGGTVLALAEALEPGDPPRVEPTGGACGGGRRVVLSGDAVVLSDGIRPTHLVAHVVAADGSDLVVLVERGDRGVEPWPGDGEPTGEVRFRSVRLGADRILSGRV